MKNGIDWLAFVILPIGVTAFAALLACGCMQLIDRADQHHHVARE